MTPRHCRLAKPFMHFFSRSSSFLALGSSSMRFGRAPSGNRKCQRLTGWRCAVSGANATALSLLVSRFAGSVAIRKNSFKLKKQDHVLTVIS